MSYRLQPQESLPGGIKRMAAEQLNKALAYLAGSDERHDEAIHEARKCFKKIRAVLRLARDEIGEAVYKRENASYRDAGRRLADARDSAVMVETLAKLRKQFADPLDADAFTQAHDELVCAHRATVEHMLRVKEVDQVVSTLEEAQARIDTWPVEREGFSALCGGLGRVYKRGRNAMAEAYANPEPEAFHEWRKRVKYLWYHIRMLRFLWPALFTALADELHNLSRLLGDDHDLAELHRITINHPEIFKDEREQQLLLALIARRRAELEAAAQDLGQRIYVEKSQRFVKRIAAYWPDG